MKKIMIAFIVIMLSALFIISASAETYLKGDINMDGKVNASDARLVLRAGASLDKITETQKLICDMNDDSRISAADARTVLRISAKLEPGKGEITIGENSSETTDKTELLSGIGISIDDFMKKFGGMKKIDTGNNTISYENDYVTIVSDPEMIHSGNISSISITGGDYMLCGVYTGMPYANALSTLKSAKWIVQKETASQTVLSKNGMLIKITVANNIVTFVEYYLAFSLVKPDDSDDTTTKPSGSTPTKPESTTKPITNEAYKKLPEQAKAYLQGNFGLDGYSYNKEQKDSVSMFITKDNIKAGMQMEMEEGSDLTIDIMVSDPSGNSKMYIICHETKMYFEIDAITMRLLNINPNDLKIGSNFVDLNKIKISQKTVKEGKTTYTVHNIKSDNESCDLYMIGEEIKRIYNYDKAGNIISRIDVDVFYAKVPASAFSLKNYKKTNNLLAIFGLNGNLSDVLK